MIGKPEWFTYRIFGWGLRPRTKEGWLYVLVAIALIAGSAYIVPEPLKPWVVGIFAAIIALDALHMMTMLGKVHDERQRHHQLVIERNVSFGALLAIIVVAAYQAYQNPTAAMPFDASLLIVLGAMVFVKVASTIYVHFKM